MLRDISVEVRVGTPEWPGDAPFECGWSTRIGDGASVNLSRIGGSPHVGTHADAPLHVRDGWPASDALPIEVFLGDALVVDVSGAPDRPLSFEMDEARLTGVERLLLRTGRCIAEGRFPDDWPVLDAATAARLDDRLRAFEATGGRIAVIGRHEHTGDAVMPDNEAGGFLAASHLFDLGHTDIAVIAGPTALTTTYDRLAGVRQAVRKYRLKLPKAQIVHSDFTRDGGVAATEQILADFPAVTAIAALNDSMAVGALAALRSAGRRVAVIGFDDMPIARDVTPSLTSVRLPLTELGERAMRLALDAAGDEPRVEHVAAELVRRESTWALEE